MSSIKVTVDRETRVDGRHSGQLYVDHRLANLLSTIYFYTALLECFYHHSRDLLEKCRGRSSIDRIGECEFKVYGKKCRALGRLSRWTHSPSRDKFLEQRRSRGSDSLHSKKITDLSSHLVYKGLTSTEEYGVHVTSLT